MISLGTGWGCECLAGFMSVMGKVDKDIDGFSDVCEFNKSL
jgi:hypothetical protein